MKVVINEKEISVSENGATIKLDESSALAAAESLKRMITFVWQSKNIEPLTFAIDLPKDEPAKEVHEEQGEVLPEGNEPPVEASPSAPEAPTQSQEAVEAPAPELATTEKTSSGKSKKHK